MHWAADLIKGHGVSLISVFIIAGAACWSALAPTPVDPLLDPTVGTKVIVEGVIVRDPDVRDKTQLLTVDVGRHYYILVQTDKYQAYAYGDRVRAEGKLEFPKEFDTDSGRTFNYPKYLLAHRITHTMSFAHVVVLSNDEGNRGVALLLDIKHILMSGIERALPEPESSLLGGLLLGEKRGMGDAVTESFRRAGVIHIIVLSGYNIALVIDNVRRIASAVLPRTIALGTSGFIAILFMLMVGASETAVRATLMALVALVAKAMYRPADGLRILLLVAAAMAVWNPLLVLFDLSYQLSILATLGLILFSEPIAGYLLWMRSKTLIEITSTTLATQITVLPLLIFSVGQVSLVSLIANMLILVAVPYAMLAGFVASLIALVSPALAFPFSAVAYALLTYIIHVATWIGQLPFAVVTF